MVRGSLNLLKTPCSLVLLTVFTFCQTKTNKTELVEPLKNQCPIVSEIGKLYGQNADYGFAIEIKKKMDLLLLDICEGHLEHLPEMVDPALGLFVDAKALWTKDEVEKDLSDPKGYFQTYFFNSDLLDKKKGSSGNQTVRDLFLQSGGVKLDFYFDSHKECEVKVSFVQNPKLARRLINPVFAKFQTDWILMRLF